MWLQVLKVCIRSWGLTNCSFIYKLGNTSRMDHLHKAYLEDDSENQCPQKSTFYHTDILQKKTIMSEIFILSFKFQRIQGIGLNVSVHYSTRMTWRTVTTDDFKDVKLASHLQPYKTYSLHELLFLTPSMRFKRKAFALIASGVIPPTERAPFQPLPFVT